MSLVPEQMVVITLVEQTPRRVQSPRSSIVKGSEWQ
jgi:hypothetical protein